MPEEFIQYLIIFLVLLVGAKDLLVMVLKKRGLIANGNGHNGEYDKRLDELKEEVREIKENHLSHLEQRVEKVEEHISQIREDVSFIKGKLS